MSIKEKINRIFHTKDGEIQRAYNAYDRAADLLDARDKYTDFDRKQELEEAINEAEKLSLELLANYEGVKNWPGIFREMHMNLARIWMRVDKFEDALKECEKVAGYNPLDADELREVIQEAMAGKKLESTQLDEVGIA